MKTNQITIILSAMIIFIAITSFSYILKGNFIQIPLIALFCIVVIAVNIFGKKLMANALDSDVDHHIFTLQRYGFKAHHKFKNEIPVGIIFPVIFALFSVGFLKVMTFLTYETRALKARAAKRFGPYSYTEITDWHNSLVGAAGISSMFILAIVSYFFPILAPLVKLSIFYAFWNMLPISNLDGTQILMGSKVLYSTLGIITLIFTAYALFLP